MTMLKIELSNAILAESAKRLGMDVHPEDGEDLALVEQALRNYNYAPDLAESVMKGGYTLDAAEAEVDKRVGALRLADQRMRRLKREAPDLAEKVLAEEITLDEANALVLRRDWESADPRERERFLQEIGASMLPAAPEFTEPELLALLQRKPRWRRRR